MLGIIERIRRSKKENCIADIKYLDNGGGAIETCITCPKCPDAKLNQRLNLPFTKDAMVASKSNAANVIAQHCVVFNMLKAAGETKAPNKSFHRKLP